MGRQFFTANIEIERLTRTLTQVTGSTDGAARKIAFLRDTANLAGQSISQITDSFIRFQASASAAGLSSERVDNLFKQLVVTGGKLGLSSEQVGGALEALSQIAGKGTLSLEELRGQLGDRLPGAVAVAAKGFGYTTDELGKFIKEVESGRVSADAFFIAFSKGLEQEFGPATARVEGFAAAFGRLKNSFTELAQSAQGSTFFTALAATMDFLASNLARVADGVFVLGKSFVALKILEVVRGFTLFKDSTVAATAAVATKTAAVVSNTAAVVTNTAANVANAASNAGVAAAAAATSASYGLLGRAVGAAGAAKTAFLGTLSSVAGALGGLPGLLAVVAVNYKELGKFIGESIAKLQGYGAAIELQEAQERSRLAREKEAADLRRSIEDDRNLRLGRTIAGLTQVRQASEQKLVSDEKELKAAQAKAQAEQALVDIQGNAALSAKTAAEQTELLVAARAKIAIESTKIVAGIDREIAAILSTRDANGKLTSSAQEQLKKLQELRDQRVAGSKEAQQELELLKSEAASG
jgi:tape measure domain-containing protein